MHSMVGGVGQLEVVGQRGEAERGGGPGHRLGIGLAEHLRRRAQATVGHDQRLGGAPGGVAVVLPGPIDPSDLVGVELCRDIGQQWRALGGAELGDQPGRASWLRGRGQERTVSLAHADGVQVLRSTCRHVCGIAGHRAARAAIDVDVVRRGSEGPSGPGRWESPGRRSCPARRRSIPAGRSASSVGIDAVLGIIGRAAQRRRTVRRSAHVGPSRVEALELRVEVLAVEVDQSGRERLVEGIEAEHPTVGAERMGHVAPDRGRTDLAGRRARCSSRSGRRRCRPPTWRRPGTSDQADRHWGRRRYRPPSSARPPLRTSRCTRPGACRGSCRCGTGPGDARSSAGDRCSD